MIKKKILNNYSVNNDPFANSSLRTSARNNLKSYWLTGALITFSIGMINLICSGMIASISTYLGLAQKNNLPLLITASLIFIIIGSIIQSFIEIGMVQYSINVSRKNIAEYKDLAVARTSRKLTINAIKLYLLQNLFILLWSLLFIIPGIIANIRYSMAFYVLNDEYGRGAREALTESKNMMYGYKMKYFLLMLSFIGWDILGVITGGIGFLWIIPYKRVTIANFYENIK